MDSATTSSISAEAGTGLKKCRPRKRAGRSSTAASSVTESELVLVASTVVSPTTCSAAASTFAFSPASSGTASTTSSVAGSSPVTASAKAIRSSTSAGSASISPRPAARSSDPAIRSRTASAASRLCSTTVTGAPAVAKDWAMPAPIRPPPITATPRGGRGPVLFRWS